MNQRFAVSETVARALAERRAVVALETTVVTHGFPHPEGVAAAAACEAEVVAAGATPATIGVLDGRIRVGLTRDELERMATGEMAGSGAGASSRLPASADASRGRAAAARGASKSVKLNLSNLAAQLASGEPGSTTVAATMFAASRVGIEVFATGGIGGVHRGAEISGDVSSDIVALARYPVAVVCAGAKAVLDLGRTVEMLETFCVPVLGYRTDAFPAFYRRDSGLPVDRGFDSIEDLARAVRAHLALGVGSGIVVANPVPIEHELPQDLYERALAGALGEVAQVRGRDVTPLLLDRMRELTKGQSVFSNLALLRHNARVAGELAVALAGME